MNCDLNRRRVIEFNVTYYAMFKVIYASYGSSRILIMPVISCHETAQNYKSDQCVPNHLLLHYAKKSSFSRCIQS